MLVLSLAVVLDFSLTSSKFNAAVGILRIFPYEFLERFVLNVNLPRKTHTYV